MLVLASACATAEGALGEREPHPRSFSALLHLITRLSTGPAVLEDLARWEMTLLADLGYGLDLSACALTGTAEDLAFVSPRTGRAVCRGAAGRWAGRLLPLPGFLAAGLPGNAADWLDGLRLSGHFLARDAFGAQHRGLPDARLRLLDRAETLAADAAQAPTDPPGG